MGGAFSQVNTLFSSSGAVERMSSSAEDILGAKRSCLAASNFEEVLDVATYGGAGVQGSRRRRTADARPPLLKGLHRDCIVTLANLHKYKTPYYHSYD